MCPESTYQIFLSQCIFLSIKTMDLYVYGFVCVDLSEYLCRCGFKYTGKLSKLCMALIFVV